MLSDLKTCDEGSLMLPKSETKKKVTAKISERSNSNQSSVARFGFQSKSTLGGMV
jgi:hypothetical protein